MQRDFPGAQAGISHPCCPGLCCVSASVKVPPADLAEQKALRSQLGASADQGQFDGLKVQRSPATRHHPAAPSPPWVWLSFSSCAAGAGSEAAAPELQWPGCEALLEPRLPPTATAILAYSGRSFEPSIPGEQSRGPTQRPGRRHPTAPSRRSEGTCRCRQQA